MKPWRERGFSLLELMMGLAIAVLLLAAAAPAYQQYMQRARLDEAKSALLQDGHFMQQWFRRHGAYLSAANAEWPSLPILQTTAFDIGLSSQTPSDENLASITFTLVASPKAGSGLEEWMLKLDQDGNIQQCRQESGMEKCRL
ncbi:type IV pilin protein [Chromobacterium sp. IIBBL 290-4]|uniref:type IV pilin protein n=1 Tax=Chromobacterium sp. IIBBL 290-4 TaxID=2953890 RepID=UPI0020B6C75B|nr:type IV pilin protein [Chromobacterium sp. IIBBL 290-4]UTH75313.1 prepilin-type N-terminal cleavage/methylation domain-containing protein [Chromobacterium sp. IIBBL 290-4]